MKPLLFLLLLVFVAGCVSTQAAPGPKATVAAAAYVQQETPFVPPNPAAPSQLILSNVSIDGCSRISGFVFNNDVGEHNNVTVRISYGRNLSASTNYTLSLFPAEYAPWSLSLVYDEACYDSIDVAVDSVQGSYAMRYPAPHCPVACRNGGECSAATGWKCVNLEAEPIPYVVFVGLNNSIGDDLFVSSVRLENPRNLSESYSNATGFVLPVGRVQQVQMTAARQFYAGKGTEKKFTVLVGYAPFSERGSNRTASGTLSIGRHTTQLNFTLSK